MSIDELISEIKERRDRAKEAMRESRSAGINSPGFNQDLGHHDALGQLLEWIEDNREARS